MIQNIKEVTVYGLLDWLERHYKMPVEENDNLHFGASLGFSVGNNDVESISQEHDDVYITLNNIANGSMPLYLKEELLSRIDEGDSVATDFLDIFNHRVIENAYHARKMVYMHYQDPPRISLRNALWKEVHGVTLSIQKCLPRKILNSRRVKLGDTLRRGILGEFCIVNDRIRYNFLCEDLISYKKLLESDDFQKIGCDKIARIASKDMILGAMTL